MHNLRLSFMLAAHILVGWWPTRAGYTLAAVVGTLSSWTARRTRSLARENQAAALGPGASRARVERSVGAVFRHTACNYFDMVHLDRMKPRDLEARLRVHGWENLKQSLDTGRGVIIATAHLGNPELAIQGLALRGIPVTVVSEPLEPPALFRAVTRWRQAHGVEFVPTGVAGLKQVLRRLRQGGMVAVAGDRDLQGAGVWLPFLGKPAPIPTGAATLAIKTGAILLPCFCARSGLLLDIFIEPPLELAAGATLEERATATTAALLQVVESYIRRYPDQWYVLAPVWSGPEALPADVALPRGAVATRP